MGSALLIQLCPQWLALAKKAAAEDKLHEMLEAGVIEPSDSPWSSPVVLVKKKDDSWRFCVHYRQLNSMTYKDSYLLPRIDEVLEHIAGSRWFSSLDLHNGYWQVELALEARPMKDFSIGQGLWQFHYMPFGPMQRANDIRVTDGEGFGGHSEDAMCSILR